MHIAVWLFILILVLTLVVGFIVGAVVIGKIFNKQMKENPPINEKVIRAMYQQMGRTPSEKQVRQVMAAVNAQNGK